MTQSSIFILLSLLSLTTSIFKLDSTRTFIVDSKGMYKIFHGVNVVVKLPPYIPNTDVFDPFTSFTKKDIEILKRLGFNLVRLGIIWESIERTEGTYDYDHLEKMSQIVTQLEDNNIAVIIDAHQDMFSRIYCGEGAPKFYAEKLEVETQCKSNALSMLFRVLTVCIPLDKYAWDYDDEGFPLVDDCRTKGNFMDYHRSPELTTIYNSFYKNQNGVLDAFANFWKVVATKFVGRPNVLGYDLWNEPWPANLWSDLKSLIPGYVDNHYVAPMYRKINDAIKDIDKDYLLFYEPIPFTDNLPLFGGQILGTFREKPVSGKASILNVHNYCCMAGPDICRDGEPSLEEAKGTCRAYHERKVKANKRQAKKLGTPSFITEFGACSDSEACYEEIMGMVKAADNHLISWAYWMYKPFNDHTTTAKNNSEGIFNTDGSVQNYKERALSRSYIQTYQGYPQSLNFDDETKEMNGVFAFDKELKEPSVIYINKELNYKNGYKLMVTKDNGEDVKYEVEEVDENYIEVLIKEEEDGMVVNVKLTAK